MNAMKDLLLPIVILAGIYLFVGPKKFGGLVKSVGSSMRTVKDGIEGKYVEDEPVAAVPAAVPAAKESPTPEAAKRPEAPVQAAEAETKASAVN